MGRIIQKSILEESNFRCWSIVMLMIGLLSDGKVQSCVIFPGSLNGRPLPACSRETSQVVGDAGWLGLCLRTNIDWMRNGDGCWGLMGMGAWWTGWGWGYRGRGWGNGMGVLMYVSEGDWMDCADICHAAQQWCCVWWDWGPSQYKDVILPVWGSTC